MQLDSLPLFPLGTVLYPGEVMPLHIFEERYQEMVSDCLAQDAPFGIVLMRDSTMEQMGCTARISQVEKEFDDGKKDIVVKGEHRFIIEEIHRKRAYLTAEIEMVRDIQEDLDVQDVERVIAQHIKLLELAGRIPSPTQYQEHDDISFFIAHNAGLDLDQKQNVLELSSEKERITYLISHLGQFIPIVEEAESVRQKVRSNGHFKDFPPEVDK